MKKYRHEGPLVIVVRRMKDRVVVLHEHDGSRFCCEWSGRTVEAFTDLDLAFCLAKLAYGDLVRLKAKEKVEGTDESRFIIQS